MKIPAILLMGGHEIVVRLTPGREMAEAGDWNRETIRINADRGESHQAVTLMHETIHAISDLHGLELAENIVATLGEELFAAIRRNGLMFDKRATDE